MPAGRPAIPIHIERAVLVEAGHRCAVCRGTPVEMCHIEPWAKVKEHTFENLIAMCPTCHAREGTKDIDRKSLYIYKANMALLTHRYGDVERRVLTYFAERPNESEAKLPAGSELLMLYLVKDGLVSDGRRTGGVVVGDPSYAQVTTPASDVYTITDKGRDFVARWKSGKPVD